MDSETYKGLRGTDVPMRREDVNEIIGTSDVRTLFLLTGDLKTGRINYINLELSNKVAERLLELSSDKGIRAEAYGHLIDCELSHGRSYSKIFEKALDEGIVPEFPLYRNEADKTLIKKITLNESADFDAVLKRMDDGGPERHIVSDPRLMEDALRILEGYDRDAQVRYIVKMSSYYAGKGCDDRMKGMLTEALEHVEYGQFDDRMQFDIHETVESLFGINEHAWLIQSAVNGGDRAIEELNWRMPNIETEWRDRYIDAYRGIIRRGWVLRYHRDPSLYSGDVLPGELLDYAIDCFNDPFVGDKGDKDCRRCEISELAAEISKMCFVAGRYEEAYQYALRSGRDEMYPLVYTMLMDGLGVEKDERTAKRILESHSLKSIRRL